MAAKHWSETQEKTNTAGISLLLTVFRLGGRTLFHLSLWPVIVFLLARESHGATRKPTLS